MLSRNEYLLENLVPVRTKKSSTQIINTLPKTYYDEDLPRIFHNRNLTFDSFFYLFFSLIYLTTL